MCQLEKGSMYMSDRTNTITVVLEKDFRTDDAEQILNSIKMIKGVLTADFNIADYNEYMAIERARRDLGGKLLNIVYPKAPIEFYVGMIK